MRFCLIVRSAQRRIVCRISGAISVVVANITQPPTLGGERNRDAGRCLGNWRRCIF
jgi:hypothetical protein